MANTICHDGYCEPLLNSKKSLKNTLSDNFVTISYVSFGVIMAAIVLYGFF